MLRREKLASFVSIFFLDVIIFVYIRSKDRGKCKSSEEKSDSQQKKKDGTEHKR